MYIINIISAIKTISLKEIRDSLKTIINELRLLKTGII